MVQRFCQWLMLVAMVVATPLAAKPSAPPRIVAVGDLHGDFDAWRQIAVKASIIDSRNRWAGGATILVQTGDIVDRGPDSLKIISHLMKLQAQAKAAGGRVIVLVGNHEAMNMTGDLRYVTAGEYAAFATSDSVRLRDRVYAANKVALTAAFRAKTPAMTDDAIRAAWLAQTPLGKLEHQAAWGPDGQLGRWTIANPAIAKVGDTMFVHGGISISYANTAFQLINRRVAEALKAHDDSEQSILYDPFGPLWYRGLVTRKADPEQAAAFPPGYPSIDQELAAALSYAGARRMVIAHTPRLAGIEISHGGQLARIDTGISRYYGGKLSYLEILGGQLVPHDFDRSPPLAQAH
ncbi:metallophosphoesterase [Sphingomonas sp.]|uniref:metallophosphoesterase n=1 Tax=Sphingomonas sp. TaxID=28214 RepID=UPI00286AE8F7|nr:metallophosphoesterase [Sphingomonas sp.]